MKGLVVDKKGRHTVVLTGDGRFFRISSREHYKVGAEIEFEKPFRAGGRLARITSIAAVFTLTLGLSYGVYSYTTPYSYVDFDINPSIELTANIFDIIIRAETFDEAGAKLLEKNNLNFRSLDSGIAALVDTAISEGYLKTEEENAVLLSVDSKDEVKKEKLEKNIGNAAAKVLDESKVASAVISQQVPALKREAAKDMGVSPGKLTLMEKARESNPGLTLDDMKNESVKDIVSRINENKKTKSDKEEKADIDKKTGAGRGNKSSSSDKEHDDRYKGSNGEKQDKNNSRKGEKDREDKGNDEKSKDGKNKHDNDKKTDKDNKYGFGTWNSNSYNKDSYKVKNISAGGRSDTKEKQNKGSENKASVKKSSGSGSKWSGLFDFARQKLKKK